MRIGQVMRIWREHKWRYEKHPNKLSVREAAKQIGISATTLSRLERGEEISADTLIAVLRWLFEKE